MIELPIESKVVAVDIVARAPVLRVTVDGRTHEVVETREESGTFSLSIDGTSRRGFYYRSAGATWIRLAGRTLVFEQRAAVSGPGATQGKLAVRTDVPGTVVAVHVTDGARVSEGDPLVTLESMKLQLTLHADRTGAIARVFFEAGASFERDAVILEYAASEAGPSSPTPQEPTP